jgi:cellulose synthase/poly-beta-1,6-N-acetylglucosamine synthase-like glycosyltransferase
MSAKQAAASIVPFYDRRWFIRIFEILPGVLTYSALIVPVILSLTAPILIAYFIIAFDLYWMMKSFRLSVNLLRSYSRLHRAQRVDWRARLAWIQQPEQALSMIESRLQSLLKDDPALAKRLGRVPFELRREFDALKHDDSLIRQLADHKRQLLDPANIFNVVILATYNESIDILEPSIQSLTQVTYPLERMMLVIAYEERGGEQTEKNAHELIKRYGGNFAYAIAVKHPDGIVGEHRGKGANISYAGRVLTEEIMQRGIDPGNVIVTTFDSDHRASKNYFAYLTYLYCTDPNRLHRSYQPIPMFYNNIWDAPAPMRVIATGNSFWTLMETMRPHRLRNFAAHAQSLAALIAIDYWSVTTIVEDGHQYWRAFFGFDGDHQVTPVYTPIYQDAVLADTYLRTFKVQFLQLRRWAWGASDIQFVVRKSFENTRISWGNKLLQLGRLIESHFSQATAPLLLTFVGYLPLYLNHNFSYAALAHNLPVILSRILTLASVTYFITIGISLISLPPRPERYRRARGIGMVLQWFLLPITSIIFSSFAAINAQTRLMFGRYLEFYVTEKATKK